MSEQHTHTELFFDLLARWQSGEVSNAVLRRDLSGLAANADFLERKVAALESSLAQSRADAEALRATIRSIERADETGDWSDYWDAVHRALAALAEHLRGANEPAD